MKKKYTRLKKFTKYFHRQRKINIVLFISMILASSLGVIIPYFYSKRIIGITSVDHIAVIKFTIIIIITIFSHHVFWFLWGKLGATITNRISKDIRKDIMKIVMDTKFSIIKEKSTGYYLERINNDTDEVSSFFVDFMGTMVDVFTNFCFFILIFVFNYICGLIFLAGTIVLYIFDSIRIKKEIAFTKQLRLLEEEFVSKNNENYRGIKDIKGLGIKEEILLRTEHVSTEISKLKTKKETTYAFWSRIKTFSQYVLEGILIVFSIVYLIPRGQLSVVMILMILEYSGFMYELVDYISNIKERLNKGELSASRIFEMFEKDNLDYFKNSNKKVSRRNITIKNLSYSYSDDIDNKVLDNVNLKIKENSATVFIGNSGSGKTTLFNLLSRILECDSNKIYIGDIDINLIDEKEFRDNVSIVNQSVFLLNDSVLENIKIVKPNSSIEEIYEACKKANIYDEIISFKNGFNTIVLENGSNLSGGQQQRIAIARAILKDTPIILFDEPTSALDKRNQELFLRTVSELKNNKTILIIAHKLNDYSIFDDVYEVKKGKIKKQKVIF